MLIQAARTWSESLWLEVNAGNESVNILTTFGETILDFDPSWLLRAALKVVHARAVHADEIDLGGLLDEKALAPLVHFQHKRGALPVANKLNEGSSGRKRRSRGFVFFETRGGSPDKAIRVPNVKEEIWFR